MTEKRALKDFRFSRFFGALRRYTSSRRHAIRKIRAKYQSMGLEQRPCTLCGSSDFTLLAQSDRYGFDLDKRICDKCGLVQTMPALRKEFLDEFYRNHYRRLYTKQSVVDYSKLMPEQIGKGKRYRDFLTQQLEMDSMSALNFIEIGCSSGGILSVFATDAKVVQGCDLDAEAIAFGKEKFGFDLEVASLPSHLPDGPRVFILSHVLEHVHNPKNFLMEVHALMSPEDYLLVEVPGLNSVAQGAYGYDLWAYFHSAHVTDFTSGTFSALAMSSGFEVIFCNETVTALLRKRADRNKSWDKSPADTVENVVRVANARKSLRK